MKARARRHEMARGEKILQVMFRDGFRVERRSEIGWRPIDRSLMIETIPGDRPALKMRRVSMGCQSLLNDTKDASPAGDDLERFVIR